MGIYSNQFSFCTCCLFTYSKKLYGKKCWDNYLLEVVICLCVFQKYLPTWGFKPLYQFVWAVIISGNYSCCEIRNVRSDRQYFVPSITENNSKRGSWNTLWFEAVMHAVFMLWHCSNFYLWGPKRQIIKMKVILPIPSQAPFFCPFKLLFFLFLPTQTMVHMK